MLMTTSGNGHGPAAGVTSIGSSATAEDGALISLRRRHSQARKMPMLGRRSEQNSSCDTPDRSKAWRRPLQGVAPQIRRRDHGVSRKSWVSAP